MNSIDTRYHNVSKTDRLNDFFNYTNLKCGISIMYTSSLQFSAKEMVDANSDRNVDIELKSITYRSIFYLVYKEDLLNQIINQTDRYLLSIPK
jgi:hypothetical protein